jgi:hypothetical protein
LKLQTRHHFVIVRSLVLFRCEFQRCVSLDISVVYDFYWVTGKIDWTLLYDSCGQECPCRSVGRPQTEARTYQSTVFFSMNCYISFLLFCLV